MTVFEVDGRPSGPCVCGIAVSPMYTTTVCVLPTAGLTVIDNGLLCVAWYGGVVGGVIEGINWKGTVLEAKAGRVEPDGKVTLHIMRTLHVPASSVLGATTRTRLPWTVAAATGAPPSKEMSVLEAGPFKKWLPLMVISCPGATINGETVEIIGPASGSAISEGGFCTGRFDL